jgi:DNA-directed RNA polymerase subunit RPC12/RpoP
MLEVMKNALELAKKLDRDLSVETWELAKVMGQLEQAIAKAEKQEPVGEAYLCDKCYTPFDGDYICPRCSHRRATKEAVYTTPPQRKPLTKAEIFKALESDIEQMELVKQDPEEYAVIIGMARAIEAAHNIKE